MTAVQASRGEYLKKKKGQVAIKTRKYSFDFLQLILLIPAHLFKVFSKIPLSPSD